MTQDRLCGAGTFTVAGKTVHRLGFGAMRLTGPGIWGEPADRDECIRVLRRAVELGVDLIDTASAYGPYISEELVKAALHPYPEGLLIATKTGVVRHGPELSDWHNVGRPEFLRHEALMSMRRLGLERIDLLQLHRIDATVPVEDQIGALVELKNDGLIGAIGLSEVGARELEKIRAMTEIATVQNRYNVGDRRYEQVLAYCEREGIGFIPWSPVAAGVLAGPGSTLATIAARLDAKPSQVALAWILAHSPVTMPIPGTSRTAHLEENIGAAALVERLTAQEIAELDALDRPVVDR